MTKLGKKMRKSKVFVFFIKVFKGLGLRDGCLVFTEFSKCGVFTPQ